MRARLKLALQRFIRFQQKVLITVLLTLLYVFGFGITFLFASLFKRRLLRRSGATGDTFWRAATGYEPGMDDSIRQS